MDIDQYERDKAEYTRPAGWIKARLVCEIEVPISRWAVGHSDETLRRHHEETLRQRLAHEAIRSLFQDRLALSISVDGIERRVT